MVRWAAIALREGDRHLSGGEESLELALARLRAPEMDAMFDLATSDQQLGALGLVKC